MPDTKNTRRKTSQTINPAYGHLQPQAVEIERAVLGAIMMDKDAYSVICEMLSPSSFYEPRHQKIYSAIETLNKNQHPVDMLTVAEQLSKNGELEAAGGAIYLAELTSNVASSANVVYHAKILADKNLARELISYAAKVQTSAFDEMSDIQELMQEAESDLFQLSQVNMKQDYTLIAPVLEAAEESIRVAFANKGGLTGLASGFKKLDAVTAGWQPSDLIILAGRPAMGKTSFALSLVKNMAVDLQQPIAFFSLEMSSKQLANRLISQVCEIKGHNILTGQLTKLEWERLDARIDSLYKAPVILDDTPQLNVFELRTKARRMVKNEGVKMIIIDYLQLMTGSNKHFSSRQEEVSNISQSLKGLAKELNIPILALSQLNRDVEKRDSKDGKDAKRPQLSDLRESGAIEQDADMVLFVHRPEYFGIPKDDNGNSTKGKAQIIIAKHRKGATKTVTLRFESEYTSFLNEDQSYVPQPEEGAYHEYGSKMNDINDEGDAPPF